MAGKATDPSIYDGLDEFATVRQLEYLAAVREKKSVYAAGRACGVHPNVVKGSLKLLQAKAAKQSATQHRDVNRIPDGFAIKGTSTLSKTPDGGMQWVKTDIDKEAQASLLKAAVEALAEPIRGLGPITPAPAHGDDDLLCVIPMGDPHFGLYAWAQETGDNFDTEIARKLTLSAVDRLIATTPAAGTCVILPLGDIFHANDQTNQTPAHKHQLDTDSRFVRVLMIAVETFRHAILRALQKHPRVIVRFVRGNHDPEAVWALAVSTASFFANEPRVEVDLTPADHWFFRFGRVLIGAHHGDRTKPDSLMGVMACDRPEDWGQTKHRYFYTGHIHSSNRKEYPGMVWESFRTLAAKDAYAAGYGYRAGRDMLAIVHHKEHGEIERHRCDVGMLA